MAENMPNFAEARRGGYDPGQVTAYVGGLIREMEAAHSKVGELTRVVEKLHQENNTYIAGYGYYHSAYRTWYPYPFNWYYPDYGYYPDYAYDDSYYDNGRCYVVQRRVHTKAGWQLRPVQVCS